MEVNFEDWQQWATHTIINVRCYWLSFAKQDLFDFDPSQFQIFATSRFGLCK